MMVAYPLAENPSSIPGNMLILLFLPRAISRKPGKRIKFNRHFGYRGSVHRPEFLRRISWETQVLSYFMSDIMSA